MCKGICRANSFTIRPPVKQRHKTLLDKAPIITSGSYDKKYIVFDIENTPSRGWFYNMWQIGNIVWGDKKWFTLSWSYSYLEEEKVHHRSLRDYKEWSKAHCSKCD